MHTTTKTWWTLEVSIYSWQIWPRPSTFDLWPSEVQLTSTCGSVLRRHSFILLWHMYKRLTYVHCIQFTNISSNNAGQTITKIRKHIFSPTQPYVKISDIYFLCSVSLPDFIAIQPSMLVFCSFFFTNFLHFCLIVVLYISLFIALYIAVYHVLCYLVLWSQDWINTTTTTTSQSGSWHKCCELQFWCALHCVIHWKMISNCPRKINEK